jgi:putative Holliday junction resolvase
MKILGLDLGKKTLGIALSDSLGLIAQGIETFVFKENNYNQALARVKDITEKEKVEEIVLGYPKNMNGSIGERGKISETFAKKIENDLQIKVILWDERLTTMEAEKILISANISRQKRKQIIDKMAAVVILQSYLNSLK